MDELEDKSVISNRDKFAERIKSKHPDKEFADDDALFGQAHDDYDDYENKYNSLKADEQKFGDLFSNDPRSARFFMDWKGGADPVINLVRMYGDDIREALDDPEKLDELEEARNEFLEKVKSEKKAQDEWEKKSKESFATADAWADSKGMSDEEFNKVLETLSQIAGDFLVGKFTAETLDMVSKALKYDNDVEQAQLEGEVAGRNAKIDEKLRKSKQGDGVPVLGSRSATAPTNKPSMGALDRFDGSQSIWDRGNEKRTSRR